ncbi:MAG TPA: hypothetical protein VGM23_03585 [Armatimonadota bacterium]|jgi:hypothetical protein
MECPKCGFYLDAFTTECPRCKLSAQKSGAPASADSFPTTAAQERITEAVPTLPAQRPGASGSDGINVATVQRMGIAMAGAVILIIAIFLPLINIPMLGGISLFQASKALGAVSQFGASMPGASGPPAEAKVYLLIGKYLWIALLAFGLGGIATAWLRRYLYLWITGGASAAIALLLIIGYFVGIAKANAAMHSAMASSPLAASMSGKMVSITAYVPLGIGPVLLLVGAIVMLTAAALQSPDE